MKLIIMSPSDRKDTELPMLIKMFEEGLPTYHLRKVNFSTRELKKFISDIPQKYHNRIVIHSHHSLVLSNNLKGICISRSHKKNKIRLWLHLLWLKFKRTNLQISSTYRSLESIIHTHRKYDYVFLTPAFDSHSGNFQAGFTEHNLKSALLTTDYRIIARGGVGIDNIGKAKELGFAGVAFYSRIWKTPNPFQEFMKVKEKFISLGIPME
jgi:thiamine-phosphate pyrophosphorylase